MIRFAHSGDIESIRELWKLVFQDSDEFLSFYSNRIFPLGPSLLMEQEGVMVASMQIIPYELKLNERMVNAGYVYGAMTHPDHRRKGYMSELLQASFLEMQQLGMEASFLIPQEKWLFDYYAAYGYEKAFPVKIKRCRAEGWTKNGLPVEVLSGQMEVSDKYGSLLDAMPRVVRKTALQTKVLTDEFMLSGGSVFVCPQGIAFVFQEKGKILVKELLADNEDARKALTSAIADYYQQTDLWLCQYRETTGFTHYGMLKPLHDDFVWSTDIYMSMMFD